MNPTQSLIKSLTVLALAGTSLAASAASTYVLTITNGGPMPISPAVIYARNGQLPKAQIGDVSTPGFVQLCQTGNPELRKTELTSAEDVTFATQTTAPILPGESRAIEVQVENPQTQSVHFEAMYGKTKDLCSIGSVGGHGLVALKQHVTNEVVTKDDVVGSGAFLDPALGEGQNYLDPSVCEGQTNAVSCLRSLALANPGAARIRFFASYLSSVEMLLENRYGAAETQSLILPSSGAVKIQLKLKH